MKSGFFGPSIIRSGTRLSTSEVKNIYSENQDALDRFSAGRTSKILGDVIGFPAGYIVGYQIGKYLTSNPTVSGRWFGIGSVATVVSILLTRSGINNIRQSTDIYNLGIRRKEDSDFSFRPTENGVGLVFSF